MSRTGKSLNQIFGSRNMRKTSSDICAQRILKSACAFTQSHQSSLFAWRNVAYLSIQNASSEDSDHNAQSDLNLYWAHCLKVCFLTFRLFYECSNFLPYLYPRRLDINWHRMLQWQVAPIQPPNYFCWNVFPYVLYIVYACVLSVVYRPSPFSWSHKPYFHMTPTAQMWARSQRIVWVFEEFSDLHS